MNRNLINILKLVKPYQYENVLAKKTKLNNKLLEKCVKLRRNHYNINKLPYKSFNYITSFNKNCENVIGQRSQKAAKGTNSPYISKLPINDPTSVDSTDCGVADHFVRQKQRCAFASPHQGRLPGRTEGR